MRKNAASKKGPPLKLHTFQHYVHCPGRGTYLGARFRARWSQDAFAVEEHAIIEERYNLPYSGDAYDRMTRGSARIDHRAKRVAIEGGEVSPKYDADDVVRTFKKAYRGYEILHESYGYRNWVYFSPTPTRT
jgi:hypothetical protein